MQESHQAPHFSNIVGRAPALLEVLNSVSLIADTKATVLIEGETGTGKELIAEAIHALSRRSARQMTSLNCGAIPENLLESEFFGHEKGAFTGAVRSHTGHFEISNGSSIFLDEVDELPLSAQVKLLRVLQKGEFTPVGSYDIKRSDVRVIAATNRNLRELVDKGRFRQDLYYRLCVVNLHIPPLRERKNDLPLLIEFFLKKFAAEFKKGSVSFHQSAINYLNKYEYPGNIRELENIIQRTVLLCPEPRIKAEHLPQEISNGDDRTQKDITYHEAKLRFERTYLQRMMQDSNGVIRKAARRAGLDYKNFYVKLKAHQIDPRQFKHSSS